MITKAPWLIPHATMQPKAITPIFFKPNQQVVTFCYNFKQRGMQQALRTAISKVTQQYAVAEQATGTLHRCRCERLPMP